MSKDDKTEALRLISKGRKKMDAESEMRKIAKLCEKGESGSFKPKDSIHFWAVSRENQFPFPPVSPMELANLAASLLARCGSIESACETAASLVRTSVLQIEKEKDRDERSLGCMADNDNNRRMWENIGKRIEGFYESGELTGKKKQKGRPFRDGNTHGHEIFYPFPISMTELIALAGLSADTGRKRIDESVADYIREGHRKNCEFAERKGEEGPGPLSDGEFKGQRDAWKASFRDRGIFQPIFLSFAERWPELRRVMIECRKEK